MDLDDPRSGFVTWLEPCSNAGGSALLPTPLPVGKNPDPDPDSDSDSDPDSDSDSKNPATDPAPHPTE
jgi:hypothetical protein